MKGDLFRESEVVGYLEEKCVSGLATRNELEMYENYKWEGKLDKKNYRGVYRKLLREMKKEYNGC